MSIYPLQLRDLRFTLFEHLEATEHLGLDKDTLDAFIDAGATFVSEFLQPINQSGDQEGCTRHEDGTVTVAKGYKEAYAQWIEGEWGSVRAPESMGGQELPQALVSVLDELVIASCCAFHSMSTSSRVSGCSSRSARIALGTHTQSRATETTPPPRLTFTISGVVLTVISSPRSVMTSSSGRGAVCIAGTWASSSSERK